MKRLILVFLIFIVHSEIKAFEIKDYLWRIPELPMSFAVIISEDESRIINIGFAEYSIYDLIEDTLIARIHYTEVGADSRGYLASFITNNEIILSEDTKFYHYNVLTKQKSIFINETGNQCK